MRRFLVSCLALSLICLGSLTGGQTVSPSSEVELLESDYDLLATEINNLEKKRLANAEKATTFREKSEQLKKRNRIRARMLLQRARHHEKVMDHAQKQIDELKKRYEERDSVE